MKKKSTINPNKLKTRDHLMVKIKNGITKAGVHKDRKKEANKNASRAPVEEDADCKQCGFPLKDGIYTPTPDGFCSDSCMDFYNEQHGEE